MTALARSKAEIASRGLVATVVQCYYAVLAAERKHANTQAASGEAFRFVSLSEKLETGGEVAHSDVLQARLHYADRKRAVNDSEAELTRARLEFAVLVLPAVTERFQLADDLDEAPLLPPLAEVQEAAAEQNPELRAALAAVQASHEEVASAKAGYLPSLALDYYYGIDAAHFAIEHNGVRNLGYSAAATLNIPVFNWGATQSKVRQSLIREDKAKLELSATQKLLLANLETSYREAEVASSAIASLQESVTIATECLRLMSVRYEADKSTTLDMLDAENTLNMARNAYVDGSLRYRLALAKLQTLTGKL
jgi:outer membrane protein TolC